MFLILASCEFGGSIMLHNQTNNPKIRKNRKEYPKMAKNLPTG
jgi:hypothetical protein